MYAPDPIVLTVLGPPPRKNARHIIGRGKMRNSPRFLGWVDEVQAAWWSGYKPPRPAAKSGPWLLRLRVFESKLRHLDDGTDVPHGDDGSATECVKDALQIAGILDNDARIVCTITTKHYDKARPRVELELRPWDEAAPTKRVEGT